MVKPNFFIVGAAKSGTTALAQYLSEHPDVAMCTPKEPHYFATDMEGYRAVTNLEEYLGLYEPAGNEAKRLGEASVYYLVSDVAIKNIHDFDSNAKILVMLRNPMDMVYSLHSQLYQSANEDVDDFTDAWHLVPERRQGRRIPKGCNDSKILDYREVAKFGEQLERVYKYFPRNQVKVILFDDFKSSTREVYREVLTFLEVQDDGKEEFPVVNPNTKPKSFFVKKMIKNQSPIFQVIKKIMKSITGKKELGVAAVVNNLNTRVVERKEMDKTIRAELVKEYQADVMKLSELISVDLEHWLFEKSTFPGRTK